MGLPYPEQETLTEVACRQLLTEVAVGRLVFTARALPAIQPVPFTVHEERIVIPVQTGSTLAVACRDAVVAFQTDGCRPDGRTTWSVTVVGLGHLVTGADATAAFDRLKVSAWGPPGSRCYLEVSMTVMSGWRLAWSPQVG